MAVQLGRGEVGVDRIHRQMTRADHRGKRRAEVVAAEAEPVHPGVDLQVDPDADAARRGRLLQCTSRGRGRDGWRQAVLEDPREVAHAERAEHENGRGHPGRAELDAFLDVRAGQRRRRRGGCARRPRRGGWRPRRFRCRDRRRRALQRARHLHRPRGRRRSPLSRQRCAEPRRHPRRRSGDPQSRGSWPSGPRGRRKRASDEPRSRAGRLIPARVPGPAARTGSAASGRPASRCRSARSAACR